MVVLPRIVVSVGRIARDRAGHAVAAAAAAAEFRAAMVITSTPALRSSVLV